MKVLVAIKRVIDPYSKVRVKTDGTGVETANAKMTINPFCEIAVEEAIRIKESGLAEEVIVVSMGESSCQEQLRSALALGADRAIHIETDTECQPLSVAKLLKAIVEKSNRGWFYSANNQSTAITIKWLKCSLRLRDCRRRHLLLKSILRVTR